MQYPIRPHFWDRYTLEQLNPAEWEALCDGCGLCCLIKLQDEQTQEIAYTKVACQLLDCQSAKCQDYQNRHQWVPDCLQLTPDLVEQLPWLPRNCAYRRVHERKGLASWHYLRSGDRNTIKRIKKSAAGRCISESEVSEDQLEEYIVRWVR